MKKLLFVILFYVIGYSFVIAGYDENDEYPWFENPDAVIDEDAEYKLLLKYNDPPIKVNLTPAFKSFLTKNKSPKVKVRCNNQRFANNEDVSYLNYIEDELTRIGCRVIDRNSKGDVKADFIVDVSWLRFSDPDMKTLINRNECKIYGTFKPIYFKVWNGFRYDKPVRHRFKKEKDFKNRGQDNFDFNKIRSKGNAIVEPIEINYDYDKLNEIILDNLCEHYYIKENKNTVSAMFKIIMSDGTIGGTIHVGHQDGQIVDFNSINIRYNQNRTKIFTGEYYMYSGDRKYEYKSFPYYVYKGRTIPLNENINIEFSDEFRVKIKKEYPFHYYLLDPIKKLYKKLFHAMIPTDAHPYAKELTAGRDVKIAGDKVVEESSSNTSTTGRVNMYGVAYYNRYFGSSYYSGSYGENISSSSNTTTTNVDAQWLRCSDFYGYYNPLAEKFANELQKIMNP